MTHGVSFLPYVDEIVVLKEGCVSEVGSYQSLKDSKGAFSEFLDTYAKEGGDERKLGRRNRRRWRRGEKLYSMGHKSTEGSER